MNSVKGVMNFIIILMLLGLISLQLNSFNNNFEAYGQTKPFEYFKTTSDYYVASDKYGKEYITFDGKISENILRSGFSVDIEIKNLNGIIIKTLHTPVTNNGIFTTTIEIDDIFIAGTFNAQANFIDSKSEVISFTIVDNVTVMQVPPIGVARVGMPYKITLNNTHNVPLIDVKYKLSFDFGEKFSITSLDKGTFSKAYLVDSDKKTIIFTVDQVPPNTTKSGLVSFSFPSTTIPYTEKKSIMTGTIITNGLREEVSIDPAGSLEEILTILDFKDGKISLKIESIQNPTACVNLGVKYEDDDPFDFMTNYLIEIKSCVNQPQDFELGIDIDESLDARFSIKDGIIKADEYIVSELQIAVPKDMPDGIYDFDIKSKVIMDTFEQKWDTEQIFRGEFVNVEKPRVTPEFPVVILMISSAILGMIVLTKVSKKLKI